MRRENSELGQIVLQKVCFGINFFLRVIQICKNLGIKNASLPI